MSLSKPILVALHEMVAQDPDLLARIMDSGSTTDTAQWIADAACKKGLVVTADELAAHLNAVARSSAAQELTDAELSNVSGGKTYTLQFLNTSVDRKNFVLYGEKPDSSAMERAWWNIRPAFVVDAGKVFTF